MIIYIHNFDLELLRNGYGKKYRTCNKCSMDNLFLRWHKITKLKVNYFDHKNETIIIIVNEFC